MFHSQFKNIFKNGFQNESENRKVLQSSPNIVINKMRQHFRISNSAEQRLQSQWLLRHKQHLCRGYCDREASQVPGGSLLHSRFQVFRVVCGKRCSKHLGAVFKRLAALFPWPGHDLAAHFQLLQSVLPDPGSVHCGWIYWEWKVGFKLLYLFHENNSWNFSYFRSIFSFMIIYAVGFLGITLTALPLVNQGDALRWEFQYCLLRTRLCII